MQVLLYVSFEEPAFIQSFMGKCVIYVSYSQSNVTDRTYIDTTFTVLCKLVHTEKISKWKTLKTKVLKTLRLQGIGKIRLRY